LSSFGWVFFELFLCVWATRVGGWGFFFFFVGFFFVVFGGGWFFWGFFSYSLVAGFNALLPSLEPVAPLPSCPLFALSNFSFSSFSPAAAPPPIDGGPPMSSSALTVFLLDRYQAWTTSDDFQFIFNSSALPFSWFPFFFSVTMVDARGCPVRVYQFPGRSTTPFPLASTTSTPDFEPICD